MIAGIGILLLFACANQTQKQTTTSPKAEYLPVEIIPAQITNITMNDSISQILLIRGREIAGKAKVALKQELKKAIKAGGTENAITFCYSRAMEITDSISLAEEVQVRRLAKKNRNPVNKMSENESNLFKSYVIDNLHTSFLEAKVSWNDEGQPVYYAPIATEALCLNCHGTVGTEVTPQVAEKIASLYPGDQALDFKEGDLRGMWSITFPEYKVIKVERSPKNNTGTSE